MRNIVQCILVFSPLWGWCRDIRIPPPVALHDCLFGPRFTCSIVYISHGHGTELRINNTIITANRTQLKGEERRISRNQTKTNFRAIWWMKSSMYIVQYIVQLYVQYTVVQYDVRELVLYNFLRWIGRRAIDLNLTWFLILCMTLLRH